MLMMKVGAVTRIVSCAVLGGNRSPWRWFFWHRCWQVLLFILEFYDSHTVLLIIKVAIMTLFELR